jgi:hypothetical protein
MEEEEDIFTLVRLITFFLTYLLTPWSTGPQLVKKFPTFYGTRIHKLNSVHNPKSYFLNIHLNIILSSISLRFPNENPVHACSLPHTHYMPRPSNSFLFYHPYNIGLGVQIMQPPHYEFFSTPLITRPS